MAELKITDLVDDSAIQGLKALNVELESVKTTYINVANELVKGIKIKVETTGDIDKLNTAVAAQAEKAKTATEQLNKVTEQQNAIVERTTNTISRERAEIEKSNKSKRDAYAQDKNAMVIAEQILGTRAQNIERLVKTNSELKNVTDAQKKLNQLEASGAITAGAVLAKRKQLTEQERELKTAKAELNNILANEDKLSQATAGSYTHISLQLELLKKAYKSLTDEEKNSSMGSTLAAEISNTDAHLKDLAADMGEFQRNVGNYAIATQNGVASTDDINRVLATQATTVEDLEEQNKALTKAISQVDMTEQGAAQTVDKMNKKIQENKQKILDVDNILQKDATTVAEAEKQNKALAAALRQIDVTSTGAKEKIKQYNDKIAANNAFIRENMSALQDNRKASEGLVDTMGGLVGVNNRFGSSLQALSSNSVGNVFEGIGIKAKALGKTLVGLVSNPWVVAFLGIAGTIAAAKWWYDYNVGLEKATKLTKEFTDKTGDDLKAYRSEVQAVADTFDKDFLEVLKSADAMAANFGISADESLKIVEDGFIAAADTNGDFLNKLQQYPAYFHEAGLSADEFVAIVTQTKSGIFGDKGLDAIKQANARIRQMTTETAKSLDAIGISSTQVQKDLESGSKSTFDVLQEVSARLSELPPASQKVGDALMAVFGKQGRDAGLEMIKSLQDIDTNLDNVKSKTGTLGSLQEQQLRSQAELNKTLAAVFDATGGSFESMTTQAKIFVNDGIVWIIKGCVDIINYFRNLYNDSLAFRVVWEAVTMQIKNTINTAKVLFSFLIENLKICAQAVHGVFTLNWKEVASAWERGGKNIVKTVKDWTGEAKKAYDDGIKNIQSGKLEPIKLDLSTSGLNSSVGSSRKNTNLPATGGAAGASSASAKKQAEDQLKVLEALQQSTIDLMDEGYDKEVAKIKLGYAKRIEAIKGNSEAEQQTRLNLVEKMNNELAEFEEKYNAERERINVENKLSIVKKGSEEEFKLKKKQLDKEKDAEIEAAKKTGADVNLIIQKYKEKQKELQEQHADENTKKLQEQFAAEQALRDNAYNQSMVDLKKKFAEELAAAKGHEDEIEEIRGRYEQQEFDLTSVYSQETADASVRNLEIILQDENLSAEERAKIADQLAKAKIAAENIAAETAIENAERIAKKDEETKNKRIENIKKWLKVTAKALDEVNDLTQAIYDNKISKVEEEEESNQTEYDNEIERIEMLQEQNIISSDEAEARKRAAKAKTEAREEELEKKKNALKYKAALVDKANTIAQIGISTAEAIVTAMPNWPVVALVAALSAIQLATAIATPISTYAKGTDKNGHKGGGALVGDGGKREVVTYNGQAWVTPDTPTLIPDLPKGARVFPDVSAFNFSDIAKDKAASNVIVNTDNKLMGKKIDRTNTLLEKSLENQIKIDNESQLYRYTASR